MWPDLRTLPVLVSIILIVNGRYNDCSSLTPLQVTQTTSQDGRTMVLDLNQAAFLSSIDMVACDDDSILWDRRFTISYVDPTDFKYQWRLFSEDILRSSTDNVKHSILKLDRPLYGSSFQLNLTNMHPIPCTHINVLGCDSTDFCDPTFCQNGGTCVGNDQCACVSGFMGPSCNDSAQNMTFDDFGFVAETAGILYTNSAAFNVTGDVSFNFDNQSRRSARSLGQARTFAHFFGHGGSLHLLPSFMSGFQHRHLNTVGHYGSHNLYSALNNFAKGFSHTVQAIFGHNHNHGHRFYFYTTHGWSHNTYGCSLHYTNHRLHMHVHYVNSNGHHHHFHISPHFKPTPAWPHTIVSTFSPHHGISLFVDGHKIGSLALPILSNAMNHFSLPKPLCFGLCGMHTGQSPSNVFIGNIAVAGASVATLAKNFLLGILGLPMLNLLGASRHTTPALPQPTTVTLATKTTTKTTTVPTTTASKGRFTLAPPTTLPPATATTVPPTSKTTTVPSAPKCYSCSFVNNNGACSSSSQCFTGEVCSVFTNGLGYTHRCMSKQLCEANKKTASGCWECCSNNLCNKQCVSSTTAPSCQDHSRCILLRTIGYKICSDPVASTSLCPRYCNKCPKSG